MDTSHKKLTSSLFGISMLALTLPMMLTACGPEVAPSPVPPSNEAAGEEATPASEEPLSKTQKPESGGEGIATFEINGSTFEFSLTVCIVGDEDIVVHGPGTNTQTGDIAFLDVDFTRFESEVVGGADIELGTDRPFASPEEFYRLDPYIDAQGFTVTVEGPSFTAEGRFLANILEGSEPTTEGSAPGLLSVNCVGS